MLEFLRNRHILPLVLAWLLPFAVGAYGQAYSEESREHREARMQWWREARFGMFIHWGPYAVPAGAYNGVEYERIGEWIMHTARIPVAEYREMARQFDPVNFDPEFWAELAVEAGMKYIVITAKHHDGFALYPSDVTDWDIADATPYGNDLLGPLAEAARRRGLRFGAYYSHAQDWVHPGGGKARCGPEGWDPDHVGDFDEYLDAIAVPQVAEILARYRPDILWWDTPTDMTPERAEKFRPLLKPYPRLIVNDRLIRGYLKPDFYTPEQHIPAKGLGHDWETCMTMNRTWGYKYFDHDWKSTDTLIRNLIDIASKGGNYLLNIGPKADGTIPEESIDRLRGIGRWMKVNGESISGTIGIPMRAPRWGRVTARAGDSSTTLYLHVFDWTPSGELPLGIANEVEECRLLADPDRTLRVETAEDGTLRVQLTGEAPDPVASVIVLRVKGEPVPQFVPVLQGEDGQVLLAAEDAEIEPARDHRPRLESRGPAANIGYWTDPAGWLRFPFQIKEAGEFDVTLVTAAHLSSKLSVRLAEHQLDVEIPATGDWRIYTEVSAGRITLEAPGRYELEVVPIKAGWRPVNLQSIRLTPVQ